ncbi:hypothetical protein JW813_09345 [Clostridium botulinum]|uniref:hypothetical protein n=1 Tax=Clostridium botulinum TaxID=1491 RepID=UPI002246098D|nr:hypothetical protein [Clostridium botulinum]UZP01943.1 hypothetical protein JW813_09345 [Clostridium botulinum]UZP05301.1 hypothetical protein JYA71_09615 [Clostridium botulinum]UZP08682.1 hypothetical protein JYA74_09340 [Clostridium botulinum]
MAIKNIEIQDSDGNIYYPHTNASVVKNGESTVAEQLKEIANDSYPIVEATGTNIYIGSSARITKLSKGTRCTLFVGNNATGNCSLNLNNYGVKNIKDSFGNIVTNLKANIPYNLCYNGSDFILQGKGGGGNATADKLLSGSTATVDSGPITGTMPNQGTKTATLNCSGKFIIPKGFHDGNGYVQGNSLASQTPGTATADKIMQGLTAWVNGSKINGNATLESLGASRFEAGTTSSAANNQTINLGFTPNLILVSSYYSGESEFYLKDTTKKIYNYPCVINIGGMGPHEIGNFSSNSIRGGHYSENHTSFNDKIKIIDNGFIIIPCYNRVTYWMAWKM